VANNGHIFKAVTNFCSFLPQKITVKAYGARIFWSVEWFAGNASSLYCVFVCILPGKAIPEMTYTVSGGTLNPTHSLTHSLLSSQAVICFSPFLCWNLYLRTVLLS